MPARAVKEVGPAGQIQKGPLVVAKESALPGNEILGQKLTGIADTARE